MKQLPNVVVEQFPFLVAVSGLGMHKAMMDQFLHLCVKGILFGTYCSSINEIKMTKYWRTHLSYVDRLWDHVKGRRKFGTDNQFAPQPFYQYKSVGEYNGILLKPRLLRKLFLQVMSTMEEYLQESFQLHPDESESSDHSFKYAKGISAGNRQGKPYGCTYDSVSLNGKITFNWMCPTALGVSL